MSFNWLRLVLVGVVISLLSATAAKLNTTPIEHVIVLMLENRSFDHMLGFLKKLNPEINGCLPGEAGCSNPKNPADASSPTFTVDDQAIYQQVSPAHSIISTTFQLFGDSTNSSAVPPMNGFVKSYGDVLGDSDRGAEVMHCFSPEHVPTMANLAMEYALFDGWHASIPGPTMPNRAYAASATSHGMGNSDTMMIAKGLPQKTIFRQLLEMGLDYRVYFELIPTVLQFKDMRHKDARPRFHGLKQFYNDVANGDLPEFTWVEPSYYNVPGIQADDQHPDHDVGLGDKLVEDIYNALRASPLWESSALIITYDEHGGFFDHVPPVSNIPNPDGINYVDAENNVIFDFTRSGVRIPTIVVSPWVKKGTVIHGAPAGSGQFEHTSVISTVIHKMFRHAVGFPAPTYLTERDAWAATFEGVFKELSAPRKDCPMTAAPHVPQNVRSPGSVPLPQDGSAQLNDLQIELLHVVAGATEDEHFDIKKASMWTEVEAAKYCQVRLNEFFGRDVVVF